MLNRNTSRSVTSLIIMATVGLVFVCALALLGVMQYTYSGSMYRQFQDRVGAEAKQLGQYYFRAVGEAQRQLDALGEDNSIRVTLQLGVEYQMRERLAAFAAAAPDMLFFLRSTDSQRLYSASDASIPIEAHEFSMQPSPQTSRLSLTSEGRFYVASTRQIRNRSQIVGTAVGMYFFRPPAEGVLLDKTDYSLLVLHLGAFRDLQTGRPVALRYTSGTTDKGVPQPCEVNGREGLLAATGFEGMYYFASSAPLEELKRSNLANNVVVLLFTGLLCSILAYIIGMRITGPLRALSESARSISLGEARLALPDGPSPISEVNDVLYALDAMLLNLRKAEELARYQLLFEEVMDAIVIYDLDGRILECNGQALDLMGTDRARMLSLSMQDLVGQEYGQKMWQMLEMLRKTPSGNSLAKRQFEMRIVPVEGDVFHAEMHIRKLRYQDQDAVLCVIRDISTRLAAENALRKAMQDAEDANRAKSGFLASMSHEIRTPMHSVLGFVDMLETSGLNDEQRRYLEMLRGSGELLLDLINDILDFSKIEAGHIELEHIPFSLEGLFERVFSMTGVQAAQKGLETILYFAPDVPEKVVGDPNKLQQILLNLLSNSLKFTSLGHVITTVHVRQRTGGSVTLEISVKDTGIGIPIIKQQSIFEVFTQADSSTARKYGGTGLGLAITKRLVEYLGGTISVESRPGHGATFTFTCVLPLPEGAVRLAEETSPPLLAGKRLLLVDDNPVTLHYLVLTLANHGAEVVEAFSVQEAQNHLEQQNGSGATGFDGIIMGSDLPELDGVSAHRQMLKRFGAQLPPTLLYMDSSHSAQGGKTLPQNALPMLAKPAVPGRLVSVVDALLNETLAADMKLKPEEGDIIEDTVLSGRVLIAEDSSANRMLMGFYLKDSPFTFDYAEDGNEAVAKFRAGIFDMVIMDIQMPGMDGYAATQAIRDFEVESGRQPVPIIALTANAYAEDREKCLAAGCSDYLTKPAKKQDVLDKLKQHMAR
ncbi:response regulator [Desulfovibrio mangrovi]|uniref:hybrid sensor histidine kinase/response regulator n=1 Tax=Desulfovibrio mangrovi TaxID=2976983 RepID=UPI00224545D0|nr:response regulator [Desulfovibrio mangrovi]UZP66533.1 response regulator [Desulfovibrio mangrovi]